MATVLFSHPLPYGDSIACKIAIIFLYGMSVTKVAWPG
jgi:hypothetical protein